MLEWIIVILLLIIIFLCSRTPEKPKKIYVKETPKKLKYVCSVNKHLQRNCEWI